MINEEQKRAFLLDLRELTMKHGILISGCGCCGSPKLSEVKEEDRSEDAGYLLNGDVDVRWAGPTAWNWKDVDKDDIVR